VKFMVGRIRIESMSLGLRVVGKLLVTRLMAVPLYRGCHPPSSRGICPQAWTSGERCTRWPRPRFPALLADQRSGHRRTGASRRGGRITCVGAESDEQELPQIPRSQCRKQAPESEPAFVVNMVGRIGIEPMTLGLRVAGKLLVTGLMAVPLYRGCHPSQLARHLPAGVD
jgi:hypothetical protein